MSAPAANTNADTNALLLGSILQPLVYRGFIRVKDLGRLAQVSKHMQVAVSDESLWAFLCRKVCPHLLEAVGPSGESRGYRFLYERWTRPVPKHPKKRPGLTPLPPPSCKAEDMSILIHFFDERTHKIIYECTKPMNSFLHPHLWTIGCCQYELPEPHVLGEAKWIPNMLASESGQYAGFQVRCVDDQMLINDFDQLRIRILLRRRTDSVLVCLFDSSAATTCVRKNPRAHPLVRDGEEISTSSKFDLTKIVTPGEIIFRNQERSHYVLKRTQQGRMIYSRLPSPVRFDVAIDTTVLDDGKFAIYAYSLFAREWKREGIRSFFSSSEGETTHGVTLHHILAELEGW